MRLTSDSPSISDSDNCPEHRAIARIEVRIIDPIIGEDVLVYNGSEVSLSFNQTCENTSDVECYMRFLVSLEYDNRADEPTYPPTHRMVAFEVRVSLCVCVCVCPPVT